MPDDVSTRRDTARDLRPPRSERAETVKTEPDDDIHFDFEDSVDTEVDFDAIRAVEELEASLATPSRANSVRQQRGENYVQILESEVEQLSILLAEKDEKLRLADGEFEKSRQRIEREADKVVEQRLRKFLLGFLEILDDLERALASARQVDHNPAVVDGVELVRRRFLSKLGEFGVSHKPAMGERFDPEIHDAVSVIPVADPQKDGVVVGVVHEGYMIGEEPLRAAAVAVGKAQSQ